MASKFLWINGKKYTVLRDGYRVKNSTRRSVTESLTGATIIQDFTNNSRKPKAYTLTLRAYAIPQTDSDLGTINDLLDAMYAGMITLVNLEGDTENVVIDVGEPSWRTTDISSQYAIAFVPVRATKVYIA